MKAVNQTKFGKQGNCLWACVASILEVNISDLPDTQYDDINNIDSWFESFYKLQDWLILNHGLFLITLHASEYIDRFVKDQYVIGVGISESSGLNHAVIVKNGVIVHDPKGIGDIKKIEEYDVFVKCFK